LFTIVQFILILVEKNTKIGESKISYNDVFDAIVSLYFQHYITCAKDWSNENWFLL